LVLSVEDQVRKESHLAGGGKRPESSASCSAHSYHRLLFLVQNNLKVSYLEI
jgi:hypothetical protein